MGRGKQKRSLRGAASATLTHFPGQIALSGDFSFRLYNGFTLFINTPFHFLLLPSTVTKVKHPYTTTDNLFFID